MIMLFLSAAAETAQPDYVALAMVLVLLAVVVVMVLRKKFAAKPVTEEPAPEQVLEEPPKPVAPGSAGHVKLHDVPPKTAAMLMAIVADKLGKPLNELKFISIKEIK